MTELLERVLELRAGADYEAARQEALTGMDSPTFELLLELGRLQHDLGREDEAEATFERAADLADSDLQRSRACARLVGVYRDQGRAKDAAAKAHEALSLAGEQDSLERADALVAVADARFDVGEYAEAEDGYRRALLLCESGSDGLERERVRIRALAGVGSVHRAKGQYDEAQPVLREVLGASEEVFGPESLETANALNDLGIVFKYSGRFDEAEPLYRRALAIDERRRRRRALQRGEPLPQPRRARACARELRGRPSRIARRSVEIRGGPFGADHPGTGRR